MNCDRLGHWLNECPCEREMLNSQGREGTMDTVRRGGRIALEKKKELERRGKKQLGFAGWEREVTEFPSDFFYETGGKVICHAKKEAVRHQRFGKNCSRFERIVTGSGAVTQCRGIICAGIMKTQWVRTAQLCACPQQCLISNAVCRKKTTVSSNICQRVLGKDREARQVKIAEGY